MATFADAHSPLMQWPCFLPAWLILHIVHALLVCRTAGLGNNDEKEVCPCKFHTQEYPPSQSISNQPGSLDADPEGTETTAGTKICGIGPSHIHTRRTHIGISILKRTHGTCPNLKTVEILCPGILALLAWSLLIEE